MESGNASLENNNVNDIGLINFLDEDNFEQFIELIRGETADPIVKFCPNYDCEHMTGCFSAANAQFEPILSSMDFYDTTLPDPISLYNCEIKLDNNDDDEDDDESSGTTATTKMTPTNKGTRTDRSRTLISERKRRGRMKEKLYALRSLVPNITKMDKASIIGDAILYVQGLQTKAKKLKVEIAEFESSMHQSGIFQNAKKMNFTTYYPAIKRITKMDINQVEEKGFYVRLICNKGRHIAASLFKALESLNGFNVQTSNLATSTNDYIFTFTLYVRECHEVDINFGNLKLWIASAFLNQGFDFETSPLV